MNCGARVFHGGARVAHATHTSARRGGKLDSLAMMPAMAGGDKSIERNHANSSLNAWQGSLPEKTACQDALSAAQTLRSISTPYPFRHRMPAAHAACGMAAAPKYSASGVR
jgi:hypothetical protein